MSPATQNELDCLMGPPRAPPRDHFLKDVSRETPVSAALPCNLQYKTLFLELGGPVAPSEPRGEGKLASTCSLWHLPGSFLRPQRQGGKQKVGFTSRWPCSWLTFVMLFAPSKPRATGKRGHLHPQSQGGNENWVPSPPSGPLPASLLCPQSQGGK